MAILDVTAAPYNAAGDGVADDAAGIQAALTAANDGDIVYFPSAAVHYRVTTALSIADTIVTLRGDSIEQSQIVADPPGADLAYLLRVTGAARRPSLQMEYLHLNGGNATTYTFNVQNRIGTRSRIRDCRFRRGDRQIVFDNDGQMNSSLIDGCSITGGDYGIYLADVVAFSGVTLSMSRVAETDVSGIYYEQPVQNVSISTTFLDCTFEGNTGAAMTFEGGVHARLLGGHFENNGTVTADPDILAGTSVANTTCRVDMFGTNFSNPSVAQNNVRIQFTDTSTRITAFAVRANSSFIVDMDSNRSATRFWSALMSPQFTVNNAERDVYGNASVDQPFLQQFDVTTKNANFTWDLYADGGLVLVNANGGNRNANIPAATAGTAGAVLQLVKSDSSANRVNIIGVSGGTQYLQAEGDAVTLTNDGSDWYIVERSTFALSVGLSTKTASFTYDVIDDGGFVSCNATAGAITATLPAANTLSGTQVRFAKTDATTNRVTVVRPGGSNILLREQGDSTTVTSNGTTWEDNTIAPFISSVGTSAKTASFTYNPVTDGSMVSVDASAGAVAVAMPGAGANDGVSVKFAKTDSSSNWVTITDPTGPTFILRTDGDTVTLTSNGTSWEGSGTTGFITTVGTSTKNGNFTYNPAVDGGLVSVTAANGPVIGTLPNPALWTGTSVSFTKIDATDQTVTLRGPDGDIYELKRQGDSEPLISNGTIWVSLIR
jgi:hypothetical protein